MSRPTYENVVTMRAEDEVAARVATKCRGELHKNPRSYRIDYMLTRGGAANAWLEIKCRAQRYDTLIVSLGKVMAGRELARETRLPFILVVSLPDGDYYREVKADEPLLIARGGRVDRNDPADMEPVVHFLMTEFKAL